MKRIALLLLISLQISCISNNQEQENMEPKTDEATNEDHPLVQLFYKKFEDWIETPIDSTKHQWKEANRVNNFVVFSEDGLIMKDLKFHTVASCKKQIIANLPSNTEEPASKWLYISLESHVNKEELLAILTFLEAEKIAYVFGREEDLVPE